MTIKHDESTDKRFDAIIAELDRRFRKAGYGSKKEVWDQLGISESYMRMATNRRSLKLKVLLDLARALDTDLPELTLAAERSRTDWRREPPMGEVPEVVERVLLEAMERKLGANVSPSRAVADVPSPSLEELSRLRLEDPVACLERLLDYPTTHLERPERIEYLKILGATFRRLVRLREANHALSAAMDLCRPEDPGSIQADILLKVAHLEYEYGRVYRALWLTERAITWFEVDQNGYGVGAALLDYAMWLHLDGQLGRAFAALQAAEPKLDPENLDDRFMLNLLMATLLERRGDLRQALHYQKQGSQLASSVGRTLVPSLFVIGARVKLKLDDPEAAVEDFLRARDAYFEIDRPISSSLAVLDAIEVLIDLHHLERAADIALGMMRLVLPLADESPLAEAAVVDLITYAQRGKVLPKDRLREVRERLEMIDAELETDRRKTRRRPYVPKAKKRSQPPG